MRIVRSTVFTRQNANFIFIVQRQPSW